MYRMHCYQARANIHFLAGWHVHRQTSTPLVAGFVGWLASSSHQASVGGVSITTHFDHQPHIHQSSSQSPSTTICIPVSFVCCRPTDPPQDSPLLAKTPRIHIPLSLPNPIPRTNTRQDKKEREKHAIHQQCHQAKPSHHPLPKPHKHQHQHQQPPSQHHHNHRPPHQHQTSQPSGGTPPSPPPSTPPPAPPTSSTPTTTPKSAPTSARRTRNSSGNLGPPCALSWPPTGWTNSRACRRS